MFPKGYSERHRSLLDPRAGTKRCLGKEKPHKSPNIILRKSRLHVGGKLGSPVDD